MSEASSRLAMLHFLRRVQEQQLTQTRQWIADEERREAERAQAEQARPPQPDWIVELGIGVGARPVYVHLGDCYSIGRRQRPISKDEAISALSSGVDACVHCRPDTALGFL